MRPEGGFLARVDGAAFGIIYGAVMVLSILMAAGDQPEAPLRTAAVLFGSVLAITLAKAFAEFMAKALEGAVRPSGAGWRAARRHSYPTLVVANLPTLLFVAAGLGWLTAELAALLSQSVCVGLLMVLGGRVGWAEDHRILPTVLGALFSGGIGPALAILKLVIH
jgi:hypothetical protein